TIRFRVLAYGWTRSKSSESFIMLTTQGYSASVSLRLIVGGAAISLSHVGPTELVVRGECVSIGPCDGQLQVIVDGQVSSKPVFLPFGIAGSGQRVKYL